MVFKKRDRGSAYDPPNMMGMPAREKQWRGKQERGLAGAAQKRRMKYEARAREAYQEGNYKFGDYWRLGLPLEIIITAVAVPAILLAWF